MAHVIADRVRDVSSTTSTGDFTVSGTAPTRYRTFSAVVTANDDTFPYAIVHQTLDEWEVGLGTRVSANVFTRTTVYAGTNGTSPVNFSAGTKDVILVYPANPSHASSPLQLGHPTDTPITRVSAGLIAVDGSNILRVADFASTAQYLGNTADKVLGTDEVNAAGALFALTDASTVSINMANGFNFSLTTTSGVGTNRTLGNPSNAIVGRTGVIVITTDATNRTISFDTNWEAAGGSSGLPAISTTSGAKDAIFYWVQSSTSIIVTGILKALA